MKSLQPYALSFLFGGAYQLYSNIQETEGGLESLPITIKDFLSMMGPALFTYISSQNGNIPLACLLGYILEKYIKSPFPEISHESHKQEVHLLTQLLKRLQHSIKHIQKKEPSLLQENIPQTYIPSVKSFLQQYENATINSIQLRKRPVESFYEKMLSLGSFGKWDEVKKNANFDEVYHISMVLGFVYESAQHYVLVERGEVITVHRHFTNGPTYAYYNVSLPSQPLTIQSFFTNGNQYAGDAFYSYHIFENNCQHFINALMEGNQLQTPESKAFIDQHTHILEPLMPKHTMPTLQFLTNVPLLFVCTIAALTFSYTNLNLFSLWSTVFYFFIPIVTYKTLFPEVVSIPKIIASCIGLFILVATLVYNILFDKDMIYKECILFAIGYMMMLIGNMFAHFTKHMIDEFLKE